MATASGRPAPSRSAFSDLHVGRNADYWIDDYGSQLRDKAAVLTLAAESEVGNADLRALAKDIAAEEEARRYTSTQENAWMLLAAAALIKDASRTSFEIEGASVAGPLFKEYSQATLEAAAGRDQEPRRPTPSTPSSTPPASPSFPSRPAATASPSSASTTPSTASRPISPRSARTSGSW